MELRLLAIAALALLGGCTGFAIYEGSIIEEDSFNHSVIFCSRDDCLGRVASEVAGAKSSLQCAFYRVDDSILGNTPIAAEVVVDGKAKVGNHSGISIKKAKSGGIMHSKYCIIDNRTVITGSFNPVAGAAEDYNNVIIINSTSVASFYAGNFHSLLAPQQQQKRRKVAVLNDTVVEVYFCPYDGCAAAVKAEIAKADSSVLFAAYSFTHQGLANELILKAAENVTVAGVMEKSGTGSEYSKYSSMSRNGVAIRLESSRRLMHHKFFIIDNETVITGSFNPTRNADERNDENLIIIKDADVASEYVKEFGLIWLATESSP